MTDNNLPHKIVLPKSPTSMPINITGIIVAVLTFLKLRKDCSDLHIVYLSVILLFAYAATVIFLEYLFLRTFKRASTGLDFSLKHSFNFGRIIVKLLGFYSTLLSVAFIYWLLREYNAGFYGNYWMFLKALLPLLIIGVMPYFISLDRFMVNPKDGYWHMGMLVLGQWSEVDRKKLGQHALTWLVKLFFLPLMFTYFTRNTHSILKWDFDHIFYSYRNFHNFSRHLIFTLDLLLATTGYILALRIFDSHVRSTEPTLLGWFVTLECYEPFWSFSSGTYLKYSNGYSWGDWLSDYCKRRSKSVPPGGAIMYHSLTYSRDRLGCQYSILTRSFLLPG